MLVSRKLDARKYALPVKAAVEKCPALGPYVDPSSNKLDLGSREALAQYNTCLFRVLECLKLDVPAPHLIPTAGLRRALTDLIMEFRPSKVVEIGTGATAIMAMLLAKRQVDVVATEVDTAALHHAKKQVHNNHLTPRVTLLESRGGIFSWLRNEPSIFPIDGVFCLPPYYKAGQPRKEPTKGFGGTDSEMYSMGEAEDFTVQLIREVMERPSDLSFMVLLWKDVTTLELGWAELARYDECLTEVVEVTVGNRSRYVTLTRIRG